MKFVDQAFVRAEAGNGGKGSLSFRREKYIPRGGPDGGDGGNGGSVYLVATDSVNTLVNFRYQRFLRAKNGESGKGKRCHGKNGEDVSYPVPIGTLVYDVSTDELLGDLNEEGVELCVAKGGAGGLGNVHFKSSRNRAPRQTTPGEPGEQRELKMELKVLADVGLLGLPNAGKSTFIRAVSGAIPKVADYPFTTLHPHLGVVRIGEYQSFVIADVPGIIKGASAGAGLGLQFLKHLERTRLLLHIVDIAPEDGSDPVLAIQNVIAELKQFGEALIHKPRWLVFNKVDRLPEDQVDAYCQHILTETAWKGPFYKISAIHRQGTHSLCVDLMAYLEKKSLEEKS